ncbi:hypothetical protein PORY_001352 [Pneumocystis oryctolagi]|uniref:Uncharacterized protein n=1 Tax=Pneumocystis oryctolagi TaxID=42067 RepID=A0ACB7CDN0_9ASCO|nr:hypothetical protein PORY_001352 [Pneumocystis oryctolagi]
MKGKENGVCLFKYSRLWRAYGSLFQKKCITNTSRVKNISELETGTFELENQVSPKLFALHARLNLGSSFPKSTLVRALVDFRITSDIKFVQNNESLSVLGACIIKYYLSEYLMSRWPRLPYNILRAAMWGYCGPKALAKIGKEWGIEMSDKEINVPREPSESDLRQVVSEILSEAKNGKLVFKRTRYFSDYGSSLKTRSNETAISGMVKSIVGGVYLHCGLANARVFVNDHIISRHLSMPSLFSFDQPTRELSVLCFRQKLEPPVSRLIAETGRRSSSPFFIVGVYSGNEKLGEGHGSSLKEAKYTASVDALKAWYLYESKEFDRPSKTLENDKEVYSSVHIDCGEVIV